MSARAHSAGVLRQPALAAQPRVPGRHDASAAANNPRQNGGDSGSSPEASPSAVRLPDPAALQAEIERRAAEICEERVREVHDAIAAAAREEGHARGLQEGREAAQREWSALAVRAQTLLDAARAASVREAQVSAELALHLAFAALRKLLGAAFASNAGAAAAIAQALAQTDAQSVVTVRVAPADVALLAGTSESDGLLGALPHGMSIEADERIAMGGCMIETTRGTLDARIETQLDGLLQVLGEAYEARGAVAFSGVSVTASRIQESST